MTSSLLLLLVLVLLSGFFSGSETALFSLQAIDKERLKEEGGAGLTVNRLLDTPRRTLASVLMGNELVNISLSTVCAGIVLNLWPDRPYLNLVLATPVLILFGEVTPKTLALRHGRRFALTVARPLTWWATLITPIRWLLQSLANLVIRLLGGATAVQTAALEEAEVRRLIVEGHEAGSINDVEAELIDRVFGFGDVSVGRLMTPAPDMVRFPVGTRYRLLVEQLAKTPFSRVPMYGRSPDDIVGILLTKDLLRFKGKTPPSPTELRTLLQEPYFVPASKPADDMLRAFQQRRIHMALVVDEHGGIDGVVTLDDLLDELVGPQLDAHGDPEISILREGAWTVAGGVDLEDLSELTGVVLEHPDVHTIGGYVMDALGHVPDQGEMVEADGLRFTVLQMEDRRILEVEVAQLPDAGDEPS